MFDGKGFEVIDEIYQFRNDTALPKDRKFLLVLDTDKMDVVEGQSQEGQAVSDELGEHLRQGPDVLLLARAHEEIYCNPVILKHYLAGVPVRAGRPRGRRDADGGQEEVRGLRGVEVARLNSFDPDLASALRAAPADARRRAGEFAAGWAVSRTGLAYPALAAGTADDAAAIAGELDERYFALSEERDAGRATAAQVVAAFGQAAGGQCRRVCPPRGSGRGRVRGELRRPAIGPNCGRVCCRCWCIKAPRHVR